MLIQIRKVFELAGEPAAKTIISGAGIAPIKDVVRLLLVGTTKHKFGALMSER
jgi:hypothetical protein